jgi:chromosome segregation ATPase
MENLTVDFERIEQELQELKSRFSRADGVLRDLEEIQIQFEDLAEIHKQLKEDVNKYESEFSRFNAESNDLIKLLQQSQEKFEQRFTKLRDANQIKLDDLKSQLLEYQDRLSIHDSHIQALQSSMSLVEKNCHDINDLIKLLQQSQEEFEQRFTQIRDANQIQLDELESQLLGYQDRLSINDSHIQALQSSRSIVEKNCHDINDIKNEFGGLPKQIQNLVDQQLSSTRKIYCDLKKQIIIMRYALIFLGILLLSLVAWVGWK